MELGMDTVTVNGVEYVRKDQIPTQPEQPAGDYVIVRGDKSGVFAGNLIERHGREVNLGNVRRLWYWDGAASLSQLAKDGVSKPQTCKFPCEVARIEILDAIEVIPATIKCREKIKAVPVWSK